MLFCPGIRPRHRVHVASARVGAPNTARAVLADAGGRLCSVLDGVDPPLISGKDSPPDVKHFVLPLFTGRNIKAIGVAHLFQLYWSRKGCG